jgi:hypothetical protein
LVKLSFHIASQWNGEAVQKISFEKSFLAGVFEKGDEGAGVFDK